MPFCPTCRFEYRQGIVHCPDCGDVLVSELPPAPAIPLPGPETEPVELCRMGDPNQVEVIQAALRAAGIATVLRTQGPITGELARVVDGATHDVAIIYVTRNRLEEARQVFEAVRSAAIVWPEGMEPVEEGDGDDGEEGEEVEEAR